MKNSIDATVVIKGSNIAESGVKIYRNSVVVSSILEENVSIGNDTNIVNCILQNNVVINRRNYVNNSQIGCFSYTGLNTIINFANIGRFCSIARNVDIGGFDHEYDKVTTMPVFRLNNMLGKDVIPDENYKQCLIGNDVWIAAGANILHKVKIGDGAIIGAGAVVTKDVEPYSIVAGLPAKKIKQRFSDEIISDLLEVQWWNLPFEIINNNRELFFHSKVTKDIIRQIKKLYLTIEN
jgi:acetyltransferase-like isoleucine patch superfamily enzyme